jgi:hypothetical protein
VPWSSDPRCGSLVTEGAAVRGRLEEGAQPVESDGSETNEIRLPRSLQEAYELRDASATPEERDYYQEHVYRLRGEEYRSRGIRFEESARRRERSRVEALRAGGEGAHRPWWKRVLGRGK